MVLASVVQHDHETVALEALGEHHAALVHRGTGRPPRGLDLDAVLPGRSRTARPCAGRSPRARARDRPGQAPRNAPSGTARRPRSGRRAGRAGSPPPELLHVCGLQLLPRHQEVRSSVLRRRSASRLRRACSQALRSAATPGSSSPGSGAARERPQVGAKARHLFVVAAGEGGDEAVPAQDVGGTLHRQQHAQVAELAELVEGAGVGGELRPRLRSSAASSRCTCCRVSSIWAWAFCRPSCTSRSSSPRSRTSTSRRSTSPSRLFSWLRSFARSRARASRRATLQPLVGDGHREPAAPGAASEPRAAGRAAGKAGPCGAPRARGRSRRSPAPRAGPRALGSGLT